MSRYLLTDLARADLEEIIEYIANDDVDAAIGVVEDFRAALERIAEMPEIGHVRKGLADEELRFWPVHSYLIIYRPRTKPVEVIRILSGFRDISGLLS